MTKELATKETPLPAYLQKGIAPRGSENVSTDDIVVPRICLLQALSPHIDAAEPEYIEGAVAGDLINNLTQEIYGKEVMVVPVFFRKTFIVWKDRDKGGGMCGMFDTRSEALAHVETLDPPASDYEAVDTAEEFVLVLNKDGSRSEVLLSMSKTKMKCSRKLQSFIRLTELDSFASKYTLKSVADKSDKGKFFNLDVVPAGFVDETVYKAAETSYKSISASSHRYVGAETDGTAKAQATDEDIPF